MARAAQGWNFEGSERSERHRGCGLSAHGLCFWAGRRPPGNWLITMSDSEDRVEVWLANGKKYSGQIIDFWPGHARAHGSLVLREEERVYVLIHRVHVTRIQRVGPTSTSQAVFLNAAPDPIEI